MNNIKFKLINTIYEQLNPCSSALLGEDLVSERVLEEQTVLAEKALKSAKRKKERVEMPSARKSSAMPASMVQSLEELLESARTGLARVQQRVAHLHTESEKCKWYAYARLELRDLLPTRVQSPFRKTGLSSLAGVASAPTRHSCGSVTSKPVGRRGMRSRRPASRHRSS